MVKLRAFLNQASRTYLAGHKPAVFQTFSPFFFEQFAIKRPRYISPHTSLSAPSDIKARDSLISPAWGRGGITAATFGRRGTPMMDPLEMKGREHRAAAGNKADLN